MTKQLQSDIDEATINSTELEELDFDVKEASLKTKEWIDLDLKCDSYKVSIDCTCLKNK